MNEKERHIEVLIDKALELNLSGCVWVANLPLEELAAQYNGCGPACLDESVRRYLTKWFTLFEPAFMIHDARFSFADGSAAAFRAANDELEKNLVKIVDCQTRWYHVLRRALGHHAARLAADACRFGGWAAYEQASAPSRKASAPSLKALGPLVFAALACLAAGCYRSITVTRFDEYELSYCAVGLKTDVNRIEAEKTTNGTVRVVVDGVATDVSERNREIVKAAGAAVGNVAGTVIEGVK